MGWRPVALPLLGLLTAGCAVSAVDLRDGLDLNQASFRDKLAAQQGLVDEFAACTARYDERVAIPATQPIARCESFIHASRVRWARARCAGSQWIQELL